MAMLAVKLNWSVWGKASGMSAWLENLKEFESASFALLRRRAWLGGLRQTVLGSATPFRLLTPE